MPAASRRVLSGTRTAPVMGTPKWASIISGVFASRTATVSPRPMPRAASAEASRRHRHESRSSCTDAPRARRRRARDTHPRSSRGTPAVVRGSEVRRPTSQPDLEVLDCHGPLPGVGDRCTESRRCGPTAGRLRDLDRPMPPKTRTLMPLRWCGHVVYRRDHAPRQPAGRRAMHAGLVEVSRRVSSEAG